jgi:hypothetical protein
MRYDSLILVLFKSVFKAAQRRMVGQICIVNYEL